MTHILQCARGTSKKRHYLIHRYHAKVISAITIQYDFSKPKIEHDIDLAATVDAICDQLLVKDDNITIGVIVKAIGCSATTLRKKGCTIIINRFRAQQQMIRRSKLISTIQNTLDDFFVRNEGKIIYSKELFDALEVCHSTLK